MNYNECKLIEILQNGGILEFKMIIYRNIWCDEDASNGIERCARILGIV